MTVPAALTPSRLRTLLLAALVLITLAGIGLFYLAYDRLGQTAEETGAQVASARESQDTLQRLQNLEQELEQRRDSINKASRVMANSQNYAYQDRLVSDLTIYARRANLSINNISFSGQTSSAGSEDGTAGGPKTATVDITLDNPVNYRNLLNFLHYVEQNLTKLKISKVTITKSENNQVSIDALNLEVHLR